VPASFTPPHVAVCYAPRFLGSVLRVHGSSGRLVRLGQFVYRGSATRTLCTVWFSATSCATPHFTYTATVRAHAAHTALLPRTVYRTRFHCCIARYHLHLYLTLRRTATTAVGFHVAYWFSGSRLVAVQLVLHLRTPFWLWFCGSVPGYTVHTRIFYTTTSRVHLQFGSHLHYYTCTRLPHCCTRFAFTHGCTQHTSHFGFTVPHTAIQTFHLSLRFLAGLPAPAAWFTAFSSLPHTPPFVVLPLVWIYASLLHARAACTTHCCASLRRTAHLPYLLLRFHHAPAALSLRALLVLLHMPLVRIASHVCVRSFTTFYLSRLLFPILPFILHYVVATCLCALTFPQRHFARAPRTGLVAAPYAHYLANTAWFAAIHTPARARSHYCFLLCSRFRFRAALPPHRCLTAHHHLIYLHRAAPAPPCAAALRHTCLPLVLVLLHWFWICTFCTARITSLGSLPYRLLRSAATPHAASALTLQRAY